MNYWIEVLQMTTICFVLSDLSQFIGSLLSEMRFMFKKKINAVIFNLLVYLLICNKCFSFWLTLIMTSDLFIASVVAIAINIIKKIEYKWFNETEL